MEWYFTLTLLGWLTFPLSYRLLPELHDRGYTISRTLGLLVWGYLFWLLTSLGVTRNNISGLLFSVAVLAGLSLWALKGIRPSELLAWLKARVHLILTTELLFMVFFAAWSIVRAANPEAVGTEKPMELAFINSILNSSTFPPHDPWLSGYAISYYYFGYVMVAMLALFTGVSGSVAFNLGLAMTFSLAGINAYGIVCNLLNHYSSKKPTSIESRTKFVFSSLIAPLFVLIASNLEGVFHVLHTRGLFWQRDNAGSLTSSFWSWLNITDLNLPPQEPFSWLPSRFWWWWRASRVLQDFDLAGNPKEIIDEFPFFSFLLGDLHPHVLAMPFAFLAILVALGLFLGNGYRINPNPVGISLRSVTWSGLILILIGLTLLSGSLINMKPVLLGFAALLLIAAILIMLQLRDKFREFGLDLLWNHTIGKLTLENPLRIQAPYFLLTALILGGLAFLNTWDSVLYLGLVVIAFILREIHERQKSLSGIFTDSIWLGLSLTAAGILFYLPFYLGFSSQAGGIIPNLIYPTRGIHFWIMFGTLLIPLIIFLFYSQANYSDLSSLRQAFRTSLYLVILMWLVSLLLGLMVTFIPPIKNLFLSSIGTDHINGLVSQVFQRRIMNIFGLITMLAVLIPSLSLIFKYLHRDHKISTVQPIIFAGILAGLGALLAIGPEYFFLRDMFGWRMNTIFKFYFQIWLVWSIVAAFGSIVLLQCLVGLRRLIFQITLSLILCAGLVYPILSLVSKTNNFNPVEWTLDGTAYLKRQSPQEYEAIKWLSNAQAGVIAEAVPKEGGGYTEHARVSTLSGKPAVLGWVGHENQWRGGSQEIGTRQSDLTVLYCSRDWSETQQILDRYQIRYVYLGNLERAAYVPTKDGCPVGLTQSKFERYLKPVFEKDGVTIYEYTGFIHD